MYYYYRSGSSCFDGGGPGHYSHVADVETEISDLLAWGHTARNGRAKHVKPDSQTPSQDASFLSNYAGNAGSQVHLKSPRNADQAKEPLALTQTHFPPQSSAHSPDGVSSLSISLHQPVLWSTSLQEHEGIKLHRPVVWLERPQMKLFSTSLIQLAFSHLPTVFKIIPFQDMQAYVVFKELLNISWVWISSLLY